MKIRNGFVSNSSSSSFICEICGLKAYSQSGEIEYCEDVEMKYCNEDGDHTYCVEHENDEGVCPICSYQILSLFDAESYLQKTTTYTREEAFKEIKEINKRRKVLRTGEYMEYCLKKIGKTSDDLFNEIKSKYIDYNDFRKYLRS